MFSAVLADIWQRNIPGLNITLVATAGSAANHAPLDRGELDIASSAVPADYWAMEGKYMAKTKLTNFCSLTPATIGFHHAFTYVDSPIKSWKDLDGKRVHLGARASATALTNEEILKALDVEPKYVFSTPTEAANMVKDKRVDAMVYGVGAPWSLLLDVAKDIPIRLIPMAPGEQKQIVERINYVTPNVIPAGTYSFQKDDIPTVVTYVDYIVRAGLPEDLVYSLTKVAWEHWDEVVKSVAAARWVSAKDALNMVAPIHPGAVKYYREAGINIPDHLVWKK